MISINSIIEYLLLCNLVVFIFDIVLFTIEILISFRRNTNAFDSLRKLQEYIDSIEDEDTKEMITRIVNILLNNSALVILITIITSILPIINIFSLIAEVNNIFNKDS